MRELYVVTISFLGCCATNVWNDFFCKIASILICSWCSGCARVEDTFSSFSFQQLVYCNCSVDLRNAIFLIIDRVKKFQLLLKC